MGYRSEVVIGVKEDALSEVMDEKLKEALRDCDSIHKKEDKIYFKWEWVKWYSDYDDVKVVMDMLNNLKHDDYGFLRLGEEHNDTEESGEAYSFGIGLKREIDYPSSDDLLIAHERFFAPNSVKFICEDDNEKKDS